GGGRVGAARALDAGWVEAILARVGEGRPLLGICLGMQWLFEGSEEAPDLSGLGLLSGRCYRLGTSAGRVDDEAEVQLKADSTGVRLKPDTTEECVTEERVIDDRAVKIPHVRC